MESVSTAAIVSLCSAVGPAESDLHPKQRREFTEEKEEMRRSLVTFHPKTTLGPSLSSIERWEEATISSVRWWLFLSDNNNGESKNRPEDCHRHCVRSLERGNISFNSTK